MARLGSFDRASTLVVGCICGAILAGEYEWRSHTETLVLPIVSASMEYTSTMTSGRIWDRNTTQLATANIVVSVAMAIVVPTSTMHVETAGRSDWFAQTVYYGMDDQETSGTELVNETCIVGAC